MLLSAVSVLVVAQSSSEIPEGLMNNPVLKYYNLRPPSCMLSVVDRNVVMRRIPVFRFPTGAGDEYPDRVWGTPRLLFKEHYLPRFHRGRATGV